MRDNPLKIFSFLSLVLCFYCANTSAESERDTKEEAGTISREQTLVIGKVTHNPRKHYGKLKLMVNYVAYRLKDFGIKQGAVLMARDNQQMIQYLKDGKVDWVTETPFSALFFEEKAGAEIILKRLKKGMAEYKTVFITHKDSGINSLADLKGRIIVFEDLGSTTGYFVPAAELMREGLELFPLSSPRAKPPADKVGYVFAQEEINIATWVYKGFADAGAYSDLDWNMNEHTPDAFKKDLKIFHQTRSFPRAVELVRKGLDPGIKTRIKEILLNAHNDPDAREVLRAYQKTKKFDEFQGEAKAGLEEARRILEIIQSEVER